MLISQSMLTSPFSFLLPLKDGVFSTRPKSAFSLVAVYLICIATSWWRLRKTSALSNNLTSIKFVYNVLQIMLSSYLTLEALFVARESGYQIMGCNIDTPFTQRVANLYWLFYLSKILELNETALIVAGRKWKKLSFLHIYHHAGSLLMTNMYLNVSSSYEMVPTVAVNSFVHFVIYSYYFLSMHRNKEANRESSIWWKKYIVPLELVQFVVLLAQISAVPYTCDCTYLNGRYLCIAWYLSQLAMFFALFAKGGVRNWRSPIKIKDFSCL